MKMNVYIIVFGIIALLIIAAALSTFVFNKSLASSSVMAANLPNLGSAPNIQGISAWINSPPLTTSGLRGKVVLVDFWTYSCINCLREIPHVNAWYSAYGNNGLEVIGVSTPEFQFEHNLSNVENAVQTLGIKYPVALDNNYSTWDAFGNEYWPAEYVIDANGIIRYEAFGEGNYNTTENVIRALLISAGYTIQPNLTSVPLGVNFSGIESPEIYLGWAKARQALGNTQGQGGFVPNKTVNYSFSNISQVNVVYLSGEWYNAPDSMIAVNNSKIFLYYKADKVNVVAAGFNGSTSITVKLDGNNLTANETGADAHLVNGSAVVNISESRLYNIVSTQSYNAHLLEIDAKPGFRIYTFTFG